MKQGKIGLYGINVLAFDILKLIALGEKETTSTIQEKLRTGCLIKYLFDKYSKYFEQDYALYDTNKWDEALSQGRTALDSNDFNIIGEDQGLFVVIGIILEKLCVEKDLR